MNNPIIDKILTEWSYRVLDGSPDPTNSYHRVQLKESMEYLKIDEDVINLLIQKLEERDLVKNKISGNVYDVEKFNKERHILVKKDASEKDIERVKKSTNVKTKKPLSKEGFEKQRETDEFISEMLEVMMINLSKGRTSGIAGEFKFRNQEEAQVMRDFYKRKAELDKKGELIHQPKKFIVTDEQLDILYESLQKHGKEIDKTKSYLTNKIGNKGAPAVNWEGRDKAVLKNYLESGGISIITGEFVPFSLTQLDHARSLTNEGEDEPKNWHWMEARFNQIKGSLEDDDVQEKVKETIKQDPEAFKLGKLDDQIKNLMKFGLINQFKDRFKNGDDAGLTEESLRGLDGKTLARIAEALNQASGWGKNTPESISTYGSSKDKNPDSPTYMQSLTRLIPGSETEKYILPSKPTTKKKLDLYKRLAKDPNSLTDKETQEIEKDKNSWGVIYDSTTKTGRSPKFSDTVTYKGKKIPSTTLIKWKDPEKGKEIIVPAGFAASMDMIQNSGMRIQSGGRGRPVEDIREDIIEGFKRSKIKGLEPLLTESEEKALNGGIKELIDNLSSYKNIGKELKNKLKNAKTPEEREEIKKQIDYYLDKTKGGDPETLLKQR